MENEIKPLRAFVVEEYDSIRALEVLALEDQDYDVEGLKPKEAADYIRGINDKIFAYIIHGNEVSFPEDCTLTKGQVSSRMKSSSRMEEMINEAVKLHKRHGQEGYLMISDCHQECQKTGCIYNPLFQDKQVIELGG